MQGLQATAVTIEVNATRGVRFVLVGLPDNAVKESHERILAAIENSGFTFPTRQITINLSPADIRKEGSGYDLPMAIGILATEDKVNTSQLGKYMMVGELSLDGSLVPIRGALPVAIKAREMGFEGLCTRRQHPRGCCSKQVEGLWRKAYHPSGQSPERHRSPGTDCSGYTR